MTLEQQRAALAYEHVQQVTTEEDRDRYGTMAQKLPAMIRSAGLCQALHFVKSRDKKPLKTLLDHLAKQLKRVEPSLENGDDLCHQVREAELGRYVWLTREVLATVTWYGRLARSEWGIEPGKDVKD